MGVPTKIAKGLEWSSYSCPICNSPLIIGEDKIIEGKRRKRLYCWRGCGEFLKK